MLPQNKPDRIRILFHDHRLVANAGLLLPATLARHLGLRELVDHHLDLGGAPGRANTGDKMLTLVASARAGGTVGVLGCVMMWHHPTFSRYELREAGAYFTGTNSNDTLPFVRSGIVTKAYEFVLPRGTIMW